MSFWFPAIWGRKHNSSFQGDSLQSGHTHREITAMQRTQWKKAWPEACTIRRIATLTSHPAAVAMDSYAVVITRVCHGTPVQLSSPRPSFYSSHPHGIFLVERFLTLAYADALTVCVQTALACTGGSSLMRRERLNRHFNRSSPVRLQRMRVCATGSRGGSLICIQARASLSRSLSLSSGNSMSGRECRLMLNSNWSAVGQSLSSLSVSIICKTKSYITPISGVCYSMHQCQGVLIVMHTV